MTETPHLDDDALDDLLLGEHSASAEAHLAACPACADRLDRFRYSVGQFNQASSAWSEARSNSISRELPARKPRFAILPAWSYAAAFFLAVALSFLFGIHRGLAPRSEERAQFSVQTGGEGFSRQQEIASDNAMLDAIASEIAHPVPSSLDVYAVVNTNASETRKSIAREVRD